MKVLDLISIKGKLPNIAMLIHANMKIKKLAEGLIDYLFKIFNIIRVPIKIVIIDDEKKLLLFSL